MSERLIRGEPESRWEGFAICKTTLEAIRNTCKPGTIIEFGSGVGTRRLAETFDVITFEHEPSWIIYFNEARITQVLAPLSDGWYNRQIVRGFLEGVDPRGITGVLVDGPPHMIGRFGILNNLDILKPFLNCPIFVDDTHRKSDMILAMDLARHLGREDLHTYDCADDDKVGIKFSIIDWEPPSEAGAE